MHYLYKSILALFVSVFFLKTNILYAQCPGLSLDCNILTVRVNNTTTTNAATTTNTVNCYNSNFYVANTPVATVNAYIGDTVTVIAPNASDFDSVYYHIRNHSATQDDIIDGLGGIGSSMDTLKFPIDYSFLPTNNCILNMKVVMTGVKNCGGVRTEHKGAIYVRILLYPELSINNRKLTPNDTTIITINSGDELRMNAIRPLLNQQQSYSWQVGTQSYTQQNPTINLPVGEHMITATTSTTLCNLTATFYAKVIVNNSCGISYDRTIYNQDYAMPLTVNRTVVQGDTVKLTAIGSSTSHTWVAEIYNESTNLLVLTRQASTLDYNLLTADLPPCNYIVKFKYTGNSCGGMEYGLIMHLKVRPHISANNLPLTFGSNATTAIASCGSNTLIFTGTNTAYTYDWNVNGEPTFTGRIFNLANLTAPQNIQGIVTITTPSNAICKDSTFYTRQINVSLTSGGGGYTVEYGDTSYVVIDSANINITICSGDTLRMTSVLDGTYTWNWIGQISNQKTFQAPNVPAGMYRGALTVVSTTQGCSGSFNFDFTVNINQSPIDYNMITSKGNINTSQHPKELIICDQTENLALTINCPNNNCPTDSTGFSWSKIEAGVLIPLATRHSTHNISVVTSIDTVGTYYIAQMKNTLGCISRDTVLVKTLSLPTPIVSLDRDSICSGTQLPLTVTGLNGSNIISYIWSGTSQSGGAANLISTNTQRVFAAPENNTENNNVLITYTINVIDNYGCSAMASDSIVVEPVWKGRLSSSRIMDLCLSDSLILSAQCSNCSNSLSNVSYSWNVRDNQNQLYSLSSINTDSVIQVTASQIRALKTPALNEFLIVLEATKGNCITTLEGVAYQTIWDNPIVAIDSIIHNGLCINNRITAVATTNANTPYNYQWVGGISTVRNYEHSYILADNTPIAFKAFYSPVPQITCETFIDTVISIPSLSNLAIIPTSDNICRGTVVSLTSNLTSNVQSYKWYNNTINVALGSDSVQTISPTVTTEYRLDIVTTEGCQLSTTKEIRVNYSPTVHINMPQPPLCQEQDVILSSVVSGGSGRYNYVWSAAQGVVLESIAISATDSTSNPSLRKTKIPIPDSTNPTLGTVTLTVTDSANVSCPSTVDIVLRERECGTAIKLTRSLNKEKYCESDTVVFVAEVIDSTIANPIFYWSTGDVRETTGNRRSDTLVVIGRDHLEDSLLSVIVTNGAPDFKVKLIASSTGQLTIEDNNPLDYSSNGGLPLTLHPSIQSDANNALYNKSLLDIVIYKVTSGRSAQLTDIDTLYGVLFDNKYAAKIISQDKSIEDDTAFVTLRVQVPCMLANSPIPIMLVTMAGQIKRIPNSVVIKPLTPNRNIASQALHTVRYVDQNLLGLDTLHTAVLGMRDSVYATVTEITNEIENLDIATVTIKLDIKKHGPRINNRDYNGERDYNIRIIRDNGGQVLKDVFFKHNLYEHDYSTTISIADLRRSDFPLIVQLRRKAATANADFASWDIYHVAGDKIEIDSTNAVGHIKTFANWVFNQNIYEINIGSNENSDRKFTIGQSTENYPLLLTGQQTTKYNANVYRIEFPSNIVAPAPDNGMVAVDTFRRNIDRLDITYANHNTTLNNQTLRFIIPKDDYYVGATTQYIHGPRIITNMSYSDYYYDHNIDNNTYVPSTDSTALDSIKNITIPDTLMGKLGHVCLFDMGDNDYVYISPNNKVIEGKGAGVSANTKDQEFLFVIDKPVIDSMTASLDTVCSEELTIVKVHTPATMTSSSFSWRSNPITSTDPIALSTMNLDSVYIRPKRTAYYAVDVTSRYGCKVNDSILITVNPLPYSRIDVSNVLVDSATNMNIVKFCPTSSVTLLAQADSINCAGNCIYQWEMLNNNLDWVDIGNTRNINRFNEELLRLSIINNGCFDYDTIRLVQHEITPVSIAGDIKRYMCDTNSITLEVDSLDINANYIWSNGVTLSSLTVRSIGGYTVTKIDSNGCSAESKPVIVVKSTRGKDRSISGNPAFVCGNGAAVSPAQLSVESCIECKYTWYKVNGTSHIVVQPMSLNRHYSTTVTGTYYAEITNNEGCTFKSTNTITVDATNITIPNISASAITLCNNSVITITAPSMPGYQYQWYRDNVVMSAHTSNVITVTTPGLYYVKATINNQCSANSNSILIRSSSFTPILDPSESIICDGSYLTLSTPISIGSTYQWYLNGVPLADNANASTYDARVAGNYYVRVTNADGCSANSTTRTLNVSSLNTPVATADVSQFCPGDEVRLSVTLCPGCQYQWAHNGINIDATPSANNYVKYVDQVGDYTVRVYDQHNTCNVSSNRVTLTQHNAPIPAIVSRITEICNNILPELQTNACQGCTYTWLQDLQNPNLSNPYQPIFGSPNDIRYQVVEAGNYKVRVKYNNGCEIESDTLTILDGSFSTALTLSNDPGFSTQICNGSPIRLMADISDPIRCNGNCIFEWFRDGAMLERTTLATYDPSASDRLGGDYSVRVTTSAGCQSESPRVNVPSVTLSPIITASSTALCGNTPVQLTVNNCVGDCNNASIIWSTGDTTRTITVNNQQSYTATVTLSSYLCSATTAPIALNSLQDLGAEIAFANAATTVTTGSICAGSSVEMISLSHCTTCTYQWVKDTLQNPTTTVLTATLPRHTTSVPGAYALIVVDPLNNCRDTSNYLVLNQVDRDPNFILSFAPNNILAATGSAVDLDNLGDGLSPVNLHSQGRYTSTALFASTLVEPGLSNGPRYNIFSPSAAVPGNYLIEYTYTTQGCDFTASDVITIKDAAGVTIENKNPSHVSYEACVTDTIVIHTANYSFLVDNVYLRNQSDSYQLLPIYATTVQTESLGTDNIYHQTIELVIPQWAKGSFIQLEGVRSNGARESSVTPYLMIHNEPLAITGLPQVICSNGNQLSLSGTPVGGQFFMYPSAAVDINTPGFANVFNNNIMNPLAIPTDITDDEGVMDVTIVYRSYSKFTNGANCPQPDTTTRTVEFRAVPLNSVTFHPISISQEREELRRLVDRVVPYTSAPSRWLFNNVNNTHAISFSGSYTTPAGAPTHFLPADAGIGAHIIYYKIHNNMCVNSTNSILTVLDAPIPVAIDDTICRNMNAVTFIRDNMNFSYRTPSRTALSTTAHYRDTSYIMRVTTTSGNRYLTTINGNPGNEEFAYLPSDLNMPQLQHDTLLIEYIFNRSEYNTTPLNSHNLFDSTSYVVASFKKPIYIEDTSQVIITGISPVLCENNQDVLLGGTPSGGTFTLQGGTGNYASETLLVNQILNTYNIHHLETTNTNYVLTYNYNGVACRSRDTLHFMIPNPLDAAFSIPNNTYEYCHSDAPITILPVSNNAPTATLLVNGIAQPTLTFSPLSTQPGMQRLELKLTDNYGCITTHVDSVMVHALPQLDMRGFNATTYCTNDEIFTFTISPAPSCVNAIGGEIMIQHFNSSVLPNNWTTHNVNSATSTGWAHVAPYLTTDGVIRIDSSRFAQDAWIFTEAVPVVAGRTYQLEYLMRVGDDCVNCDPAAMEVKVGTAPSVGGQSIPLTTYPSMDNNYSGFFRWYRHSWVAPSTGVYNFSFHAIGRPTSTNRVVRDIAIDQVLVREVSPMNCPVGIGALSGPGIVATANNDSIYSFAPATAPGDNHIVYQFTDNRGCSDSIVKNIRVEQHTIVSMTNLDSTYCWNEQPVSLGANVPGGVYSIRRLDTATGNNMLLNNAPITSVTYNTSVPLVFLPHVVGQEELTYTYRDPLTQCVSIVKDTVTVVGIPDSVQFLMRVNHPSNTNALYDVYCENATPAVLHVEANRGTNITNGTFYGSGVVNGATGSGQALFNPALAKATMGRVGNDTLYYTYIASNGCVDTTSQVVRIEEIPTLSFEHATVANVLPDSICINASPIGILIRHTQMTGGLGDIFVDSLLSSSTGYMESVPVANMLIGGTIFDPIVFGVGTHTIEYTYTNIYDCSNTIRKDIRVDPVPVISFEQLPADRIYCENESGNFIHAMPAYYPGSGYLEVNGVRYNSSSTYIDPTIFANDANAPMFPIHYVYTSPQGCSAQGADTFYVHRYPRIDLTNLPSTFCSAPDSVDLLPFVQPQTGIFTDNLHIPSIVSNHFLDLSGAVGPRRVHYHVVDPTTTCYNVDSLTITLYTVTPPAFDVVGGCQNDDVIFEGTMALDPLFDQITAVRWSFGNGVDSVILGDPNNPTVVPSVTYQYSGTGLFVPTLTVYNNGICSTSISKEWVVSQHITINGAAGRPYFENFENGANTGWYAQDEAVAIGASSIWSHQLLENHHIVDSNNMAWVTYGRPDDTLGYTNNVRSYLYTPCFDMTQTWKPMISMDLWTDFIQPIDGATLEYYDAADRQWKVLGNYDPNKGINWYNADFLASSPGVYRNSGLMPQGWSGDTRGWRNSRYRLDQFVGQDNVRFRIAFATGDETLLFGRPQGIALDNFWILERSRNVLVEHYTTHNYPDIYQKNDAIYDVVYNPANGLVRDVNFIQYHLPSNDIYSYTDSMYLQAIEIMNRRNYNIYANISTANIFRVNGFPKADSSHLIEPAHIEQEILSSPKFIIHEPIVNMNYSPDSILIELNITPQESGYYEDVYLYTIITEDGVPHQNEPLHLMKGVARSQYDVKAIPNYITEGQSIRHSMVLSKNNYDMRYISLDSLNIVVFLQDHNTKEVYQSRSNRDLSIYGYNPVSVVPIVDETSTLKLYPNPATGFFNVAFSKPLETAHDWMLVDMLGRVLQQGNTAIGTEIMQVETGDLPSGNYVFVIKNESVYTQRQVIIIRP